MQYIFLSILSIPFLYINCKIILSDIKHKIIPNKYLLKLIIIIPLFYFYLNYYNYDINFLNFISNIFFTLFISFILYYIWIWSAWDAKYLLLLALFIPHIWIIPFLWNIALLTIIYLFWYFIWFYFWKCLFNWKYFHSLYKNIFHDLKDKSLVFLKHTDWNFYKKIIFLKILKWISFFLIIFVSIRLLRLYMFSDIMHSIYYKEILTYLKEYSYYILFSLIWIFFWTIYLIKLAINKLKKIISNKSKEKNNFIIDFVLITILLFLLLSFIIYEYIINPSEIINYLLKIFTFYIILYLIFVIIRYTYKITFSIAETYYIDIKDLKEGDIIDKEYLVNMFWDQISLLDYWNKWLIIPSPTEFFKNIENPIDTEVIKNLNKIYEIVNTFHKNNNWTPENNKIKILNTFAFWVYIFAGFIISFLFWNIIIQYLISIFLEIIKS